jgi:hypothetical protein
VGDDSNVRALPSFLPAVNDLKQKAYAIPHSAYFPLAESVGAWQAGEIRGHFDQ